MQKAKSAVSFLQNDWANSLGWMLVHSLWQHFLIALLCALLLFFTKKASSQTRYLIAFGGILSALFTSSATLYQYLQASTRIVLGSASENNLPTFINRVDELNIAGLINQHMSSIMLVWLLGIVIYGLKALFSYYSCQQLKTKNLTDTPDKWRTIFTKLAAQIGITKHIELRISLTAITPCVMGYVKPVVLLPFQLLLSMNQQQIEAILLHELAHVQRQDYLFGIIQLLVKSLFFFNPFLHWLSAQMDREREHACDDLAVTINQDPLLFANTLKELAHMNNKQFIAMNISGNKPLLARITRLFHQKPVPIQSKNAVAGNLLCVFSGVLIACCVTAAPDLAEKMISLDVNETKVSEVISEVNKKCNLGGSIVTDSDEKVTLKLDNISCQDAIQLLNDFVDEKPGKA